MSRYNIETAKSAGFCFGVKRAVEIAEKTAEENGSCYTLGELIHNGSEIARLQKLGVYPIDSPDDLPQGRTLIIRSHGVAKSVTDYIHDKGISCIDATCPFVAKIHNIVSKSECPVIIAGDPDHPEVITCPTCGRTQYPCTQIANEVEKRLQGCKKSIKVAVMGCVVNGPGEAREADIGIAGGKGEAVLFIHGKPIKKLTGDNILDQFMDEIYKL